MRTIQMTLEEDLVRSVDHIVKELRTTRSAFARQALREAILRMRIRQLEQKHKKGYIKNPVEENEFDAWEKEQVWEGS